MADYDMDPDAVTLNINRLRAAGDDFGSLWEKRRQALEASRAGVGSDVIAQAFLEKYVPLAEKLTARAEGIAATYGALCDDALGCVVDYRAADTQGTGAVNRLTATDGRDPLG